MEALFEALRFATTTEEPEDDEGMSKPLDWLESLPNVEVTSRKRHTDVSQDPRYTIQDLSASDGDAKCTEVLARIPLWLLPIG
jgi:hypothetical protein